MMRSLKIPLLALMLLVERGVLAAPALCSPGYQDSTCVSPIHHRAIPAPMVPAAPVVVSVGYGCPGWTIYTYSDGSVQRVWDPDNPDNVLVQGGACSDRG